VEQINEVRVDQSNNDRHKERVQQVEIGVSCNIQRWGALYSNALKGSRENRRTAEDLPEDWAS